MYNENMTKRASTNCAPDNKKINLFAAGFTIIETMLFLAIAGLVFAGLVVGTNGAIRRQRYKDSVQGFVDDLRDLYSLAENPQVLTYSGTANCASGSISSSERGRSNCSVYGIYAIISPTQDGEDNVEAYWVVGKDQAAISSTSYDSDASFFAVAHPGIDISFDSGSEEKIAKKHSILWGADVSIPCNSAFSRRSISGHASGCDTASTKLSDGNNYVAMFIYRSPMTGSIKTVSALIDNRSDARNYGHRNQLWEFIDGADFDLFKSQEVSLCISSGAGMSYDGGLRMVKIDENGSNSNAVRLIEADSEENKCN